MWLRLFWHFLDTTVVNSYIIYKQKTEKAVTLKMFRLDLINGLIAATQLKNTVGRKFSNHQPASSYKVFVSKHLRTDQSKHMPLLGTSRHGHCSTAKVPRRTRWVCNICNVGLCKTSHKNCFLDFHKK